MAEDVRSNGGLPTGEVVDVCVPPQTTTCLGIVEFGMDCVGDNECGVDDGDVEDAACEGLLCTYRCAEDSTYHSEWCPEGTTCDDPTGYCTAL